MRSEASSTGRSWIRRLAQFFGGICGRQLGRVEDGGDTTALEHTEEHRRQVVDEQEGAMTDTQYRRHVENEYGVGKWADKVTDELVEDHHKRSERPKDEN